MNIVVNLCDYLLRKSTCKNKTLCMHGVFYFVIEYLRFDTIHSHKRGRVIF